MAREYQLLLREVSRSFYLTVKVLPRSIRWPIGLAYLLARATDTIADTEMVPLEERLQALRTLQRRIRLNNGGDLQLQRLLTHQGTPGERQLLGQVQELLRELQRLPAPDQDRIREVLHIITSGQELDLTRFQDAAPDRIIALETESELDDYAYRVAGCVGVFWTRMCRAHVFPQAAVDEQTLSDKGMRFGKGLQLINILRDLPSDLRRGRCYFPSNQLATLGLNPSGLLLPSNETQFRPLYSAWLGRACEHLTAGWEYTNELPFSCVRIRLACAWPILIGISTLDKLAAQPILDASRQIKISRAEVRRILAKSLLLYPWPWAWRRLFRPSIPQQVA